MTCQQALDNLQRLLDFSLDVICSVDEQGRFLTVNAAAKQVWGYDPGELVGTHYINMVFDEDKAATIRIANDIMTGLSTTSFENRFICKDGTVKPILWSSRWVAEEKVMYAVAKDATQIKKAQKVQQRQEKRLRMAYKLAKIAWWELDLATQTFTASDELFQMYGLPVPEDGRLTVAAFFSTVHPEDLETLRHNLQAMCRELYFDFEHRVVKPSGEVIYVIHNSELIWDNNGLPVSLHGSTKDVTRLKLSQLQLETSQKELQQKSATLTGIIESLGDGFYTVDRNWIITYWNKNIEQITQIQREAVLGKSLWEVYPKAKSLSYYQQYTRAIAENISVHFEEWSPTHRLWVEVNAHPTSDGLSVYIRDITQRKRNEEEHRLLDEKLQQANENLQSVLESMSDGYYSIDRNWTITFATDRMAAMAGLNKEDYLGKNLWACFPDLVGTEFYTAFNRAFSENTFVSFETYYPPFDLWSEVNVYPKGDELAVYQKDITERKRQEQALQISNERFEFVSKATSDVVWDWDVENGKHYINQSFTDVFGYKLSEGQSLHQLWLNGLHPEDRERVISSQREALLNADVSQLEDQYRFCKANGEYAYVTDRAVVVRNEEGRAVRMIGAVRDVTREKKQERRLEFIAKATSEVLWERAVDSNEVDITTEKFNRIFGYSLTGDRSQHTFWLDKVHPEDLPGIIANRENALAKALDYYVDEYRFKRADGSWAIVKERTYLIKSDEGKVVSLLGAIEDITPQRMAEKALQEREAGYRQLFNNAPLPTMISDAETLQYLDVNSAALEQFGYSREEFLAMAVLDIRPEEEKQRTLKHINNVRAGIANPLEPFVYRRKNGETLLAEVSATLMVYQGKKALLATLNDVTERTRLQQQLLQEKVNYQRSITQAAIEAQERERSDIGKELHDNVNQVLTTVKLYVENLKYFPEQRAAFEEKASTLVQKSINEIRRLSKALVTPTIRDVGFKDTLAELVASYRDLNLFTIRCSFDFNEANLDKGVKLTVYRILQEAFNNTVKYAGAKLVELTIRGTQNNLKLNYADDGKGFDLASVKKGLGLCNIKNRVDAYKGAVQIRAGIGKGCRFAIVFPLRQAEGG
jgi:PAS domain S-box-containing protein